MGSTPPRRGRHAPEPEPRPPVAVASTIDLHTHSTRSDGVLVPERLAADAASVGVRVLALTDHDTLAGVRDLRASASLPPGLELLPGVEINAITPLAAGLLDGEVHVLGLGVDPEDEAFEAVLAGQRTERRRRFERTLERLRELDLSVDAAADALDPSADDALGRPTIGRLLVAHGYATSVQDAFERLLGRGAPAYVPRSGLAPAEAVRAIRAAAGLPVLAHFSEAPTRLDIVRELIEFGLGGLEVFYRSWDPATVDAVRAVATNLALVATGGSDYHGDTGTYAEAHAALSVPADVAAGVHAWLARPSRPETA
jgi:predicted metal-dependent phosphoesterase TrpH